MVLAMSQGAKLGLTFHYVSILLIKIIEQIGFAGSFNLRPIFNVNVMMSFS